VVLDDYGFGYTDNLFYFRRIEMFKIKKTFEVAISHKLNLSYESPCQRDHGHNLRISVWCVSEELNENGMVIDFTEIKKLVHDQLDHRCLNEIKGLGWEHRENCTVQKNPTAERIAKWICMQIDKCYRVDVQESTGNVATYTDDSVRRE